MNVNEIAAKNQRLQQMNKERALQAQQKRKEDEAVRREARIASWSQIKNEAAVVHLLEYIDGQIERYVELGLQGQLFENQKNSKDELVTVIVRLSPEQRVSYMDKCDGLKTVKAYIEQQIATISAISPE